MTTLPRNILFGSMVMLAALCAASCATSDTGETLSVTAVPGSPMSVQGNSDTRIAPVINYRGKKKLKYSWTYDLPPGGQLTVTNSNAEIPTFNFQQLGTYNLHLLVFEDGGTISKSSNGSVVVGGFAKLTASVTAPAITGTPNVVTGQITGSSAITVSVSGGKSPYSYSWSAPSAGTLSSSVSANPVLTATVSPGSTISTTVTVTDSQTIPATIVITVLIPVTSSG